MFNVLKLILMCLLQRIKNNYYMKFEFSNCQDQCGVHPRTCIGATLIQIYSPANIKTCKSWD